MRNPRRMRNAKEGPKEMGHTGLRVHSSRAPEAVVSAEEGCGFGHHGAGDEVVGEPFVDWSQHLDCLAERAKRMEKLEGREIERDTRLDMSNTVPCWILILRYHGSARGRVSMYLMSIQVRLKQSLGHE